MSKWTLVAGIAILCIAIAASGLFFKERMDETRSISSLKKDIELVRAEKISITGKLEAKKAESKQVRQELEKHNQAIQMFLVDIDDAQKAKSELTEELSEKEKEVQSLGERLAAVTLTEKELKAELDRAKQSYDQVSQEIEAARKEKLTLEDNIKSRLAASRGVELKKIVVRMSPTPEGNVIELNNVYEFAIINLGQEHNIQSGDIFGIYRNGEFIAKAIAEDVFDDMSSIVLLDEWQAQDIKVNDTVKLLES
jgi:hypothetical protein